MFGVLSSWLSLKLDMKKWLILLLLLKLSFQSTDPDVEGEALLDLLKPLNDSDGRITDWNPNFVSPCFSWSHITCRNGKVISLSLASIGLSGTLSPAITRLKYLTKLDIRNNSLRGALPDYLANMTQLQNLNLANNDFSGSIPTSWGELSGLKQLDLSSNDLSGSIPSQLYSAPNFNFSGTRFSCGSSLDQPCVSNAHPQVSTNKAKLEALVTSTSCAALILLLVVAVFAYRYHRHLSKLKQDVFADVAGEDDSKISFGRLRRFSLLEIHLATDNFGDTNITGQGGFGKVYRGVLLDNTKVAVKRLADCYSPGGEAAFLREVHLISVAVHRNLLRLIGFCTTSSERTQESSCLFFNAKS